MLSQYLPGCLRSGSHAAGRGHDVLVRSAPTNIPARMAHGKHSPGPVGANKQIACSAGEAISRLNEENENQVRVWRTWGQLRPVSRFVLQRWFVVANQARQGPGPRFRSILALEMDCDTPFIRPTLIKTKVSIGSHGNTRAVHTAV
jgi:hypothetical protein